VSEYADGIALMGTNLLDGYIPILKEYDRLWVCLDKDAATKCVVIAKELSFYTETKVILANKDPKNMLPFELDHYFTNL
jgi:hypothetical protein